MTIDPALAAVLRATLSLLFASAAFHKLRDIESFGAAVDGYQLAPPSWTVPVGAALIALEIGVAAGVWLPRVAPVAALAGVGLLLLYAGAMAINLRLGRRDIECGCGGPAGRQVISAGLAVRNALLAAAALCAALPPGERTLGWVDWVTMAGGVTALSLLYIAASVLQGFAGGAALHRHGAVRGRDGSPSSTRWVDA